MSASQWGVRQVGHSWGPSVCGTHGTRSASSSQRTHPRTTPHLFELLQTRVPTQGFSSAPRLQDETFVRAERAADLAGDPRGLVVLAELRQAGLAAESERLAVHCHRERTLGGGDMVTSSVLLSTPRI